MENKDLIISKAIEQLEERKKHLIGFKPIENYSFKTNCRFNEKNIKTLNISELVMCLIEVFNYDKSIKHIKNELPILQGEDYTQTFKMYNHTVEEWESDIRYLISKIHYNNEVKKIEKGSKQLECFYSKDKQDEIAINGLIKELGL
jgi:hypothetical protein